MSLLGSYARCMWGWRSRRPQLFWVLVFFFFWGIADMIVWPMVQRQNLVCFIKDRAIFRAEEYKESICEVFVKTIFVQGYGPSEDSDTYIRVRNARTGELVVERRISDFHFNGGGPGVRSDVLWFRVGEGDKIPWPPSWWTRFTAKLP